MISSFSQASLRKPNAEKNFDSYYSEATKMKIELPGLGRDSSAYTLWWTAGDGQWDMFGGNFSSEEAAISAIPAVEAEFRFQCSEDVPYDEDSTWSVEPPEEEED